MRLVRIPDHAEIAMTGGQLLDQHVLGAVGVLVLVDQHVAEALLIAGEHIGEGAEQLDGHHQEIIEVHGGGLEQTLLIEAINVRHLLVKEAIALVGKGLVVDQLVLRLRDHRLHRPGREALGVDVEVFQDQIDQPERIGLVVDGEPRAVAEP